MPENIKIRSLQKEDDSAQLVKLFQQLIRQEVKFSVEQALKVPNLHCYVADNQGEIVGFAALTLRFVPTKGYVGVIEDVVVDEKHRRKGLGTRLLEKIFNKANELSKELNIVAIELTSNKNREAARKLYRKIGFELLDTGVFRRKLFSDKNNELNRKCR